MANRQAPHALATHLSATYGCLVRSSDKLWLSTEWPVWEAESAVMATSVCVAAHEQEAPEGLLRGDVRGDVAWVASIELRRFARCLEACIISSSRKARNLTRS